VFYPVYVGCSSLLIEHTYVIDIHDWFLLYFTHSGVTFTKNRKLHVFGEYIQISYIPRVFLLIY
jgi:hypothetical protein